MLYSISSIDDLRNRTRLSAVSTRERFIEVLPQPGATEEGPQQALARQGLARLLDDEVLRLRRKITQHTANLQSFKDRVAECCMSGAQLPRR